MKPRKFYAVQQAGREADIYIFGDIVADRFWEEETSAYSLKEAVKELDADTINVYIDSYGGVVSEGWAIYNELRRHPARVRTYGTGFVASAALYPFMAGDERYAMDPSAYFFHQMLSLEAGNADDLRKAADDLEKLNEIGRAAFTDNTRLTAEDVLALEKNETWLSPQQALELGIATAIVKGAPAAAPVQNVRGRVIGRMLSAQKAPKDPEPEPEPQPPSLMQMLGGIFEK